MTDINRSQLENWAQTVIDGLQNSGITQDTQKKPMSNVTPEANQRHMQTPMRNMYFYGNVDDLPTVRYLRQFIDTLNEAFPEALEKAHLYQVYDRLQGGQVIGKKELIVDSSARVNTNGLRPTDKFKLLIPQEMVEALDLRSPTKPVTR